MPYDKDRIPPLSEEAKTFKYGIYEHFKGGKYKVICIGRSSEKRDEEFVVYQHIDGGDIWIRPLKMFLENVSRDDYNGSRFKFLKESDK